MKKYLVILFLLVSTSVYAQGVLNFAEDTTPTSDDIIYVINDPVGVPGDRKVTLGNLKNVINIASDPIWDAAGDLVVGTGANTAARLPKGTAGQIPRTKIDESGLEWTSSITGLTITGDTASKAACYDANKILVACTNLTDVTPLVAASIDTSAEIAAIVGDETGSGALVFGTGPAITAAEVDGSTAFALSAAQVSRTIINNYGQGAANVNLTLPTAAAGLTFIGIVGTAQAANYWRFTSGSANIYANVGAGLVSGKTYISIAVPTVGARISFFTVKTGAATWSWMCGSSEGTWSTD